MRRSCGRVGMGPQQWPNGPTTDGVLATTDDGGRTWSQLPIPKVRYGWGHGAALQVRFADRDHGYLFGSGFYLTTDGGRQWRRQAAPGTITDLQASGGRVYALVESCPDGHPDCGTRRLYTGAVGDGQLRLVDAVPASSITALAVSRHRVYLITVPTSLSLDASAASTLWASADGRNWSRGSTPCTWPDTQAAALAAWADTGLALICGDEPSAGQQPKTAYRSTDGGAHWSRQADLSGGGYVGSLAAADNSTWLFGEDRGGLLVTQDGGRTWTPTHFQSTSDGSPVEGWGQVLFTDAEHAVAVPSTLNGAVLAFSANRGDGWTVEHFS
jgi:photosystem II stability/assembly factor-like uncharacterized protein